MDWSFATVWMGDEGGREWDSVEVQGETLLRQSCYVGYIYTLHKDPCFASHTHTHIRALVGPSYHTNPTPSLLATLVLDLIVEYAVAPGGCLCSVCPMAKTPSIDGPKIDNGGDKNHLPLSLAPPSPSQEIKIRGKKTWLLVCVYLAWGAEILDGLNGGALSGGDMATFA